MSTRRARPSLLVLCLPVALAAGAALAARQDVAQQDLGPQAAAAEAPAVERSDDTLIAWPCLDAPGCEVGAPDVATGPQAAGPMEATAIPLPAALGLMGAGLTVMGLFMRRRRGG